MASVWNGFEMIVVSDAEAQEMVDKDLGQWLEHHDGSAFKHRSELSGYQNKAMTTSTKPEKVEPAKTPAAKKSPKKKG